MPNLFEEILTCANCPDVDVITDENQQEVESHLDAEHMRGNNRISTTAFIVAHRPEDRDRIQSLYEEAQSYLDSDFVSDFLYHFDQRCWELDVYKYLVDNSITIHPPQRGAGPDFDTSIGYVECIAVTRGIGENAVPYPKAAMMHEDGAIDEIEAQPDTIRACLLLQNRFFSRFSV